MHPYEQRYHWKIWVANPYKLTKKTEISLKLTKTFKKLKNQPKKDNFESPPQGVDQLLHVNQLWGVNKNTFFWFFFRCFYWFQPWNHWKWFEMNKKGWQTAEKCFDQLLGARSTHKLVEIHNKWYGSQAAQIERGSQPLRVGLNR